MPAPPDPQNARRGAVGSGTPKIAEGRKKQEQRYQVPLDFQPALFLLVPMMFLVAVLAFAGGAR